MSLTHHAHDITLHARRPLWSCLTLALWRALLDAAAAAAAVVVASVCRGRDNGLLNICLSSKAPAAAAAAAAAAAHSSAKRSRAQPPAVALVRIRHLRAVSSRDPAKSTSGVTLTSSGKKTSEKSAQERREREVGGGGLQSERVGERLLKEDLTGRNLVFYPQRNLEKLREVTPDLTLAPCRQSYAIYPELYSAYCGNSALMSATAIATRQRQHYWQICYL